jgi:tetratricopeptide (TPR) repeat protein
MSVHEPQALKPPSLQGRKFTPLSGVIRKRKKPLELNPLPANLLVNKQNQESQRSIKSSSRKGTAAKHEEELQIEAKVTRESVCMELLESGNPQSYIDFYYMTHGQFDSNSKSYSEEQLLSLKNNLAKAEVSLRTGDTEESILTYTDLGEMFMTRKEYKSACYFFERCLEISRLNDLYEYEALAFKGIGDTYVNQGDIFGSMQEYEDGLKIAETYDVKNAIMSISA